MTSSAAAQARDHGRRHIEPARLQQHRHHGEAGERVMRGRHRRLPQPVMRRKVAVTGAELVQARLDHGEMVRLVLGDGNPVVIKRNRPIEPGETPDQIPGQVDGVQFDMRDRVEEGDAPADASGAPARHVAGRQQLRRHRARRARRHGGGRSRGRQTAGAPILGAGQRARDFLAGIGLGEDRARGGGQASARRRHSFRHPRLRPAVAHSAHNGRARVAPFSPAFPSLPRRSRRRPPRRALRARRPDIAPRRG